MAMRTICLFAGACLAASNGDFSSLVTSVESELNNLSQEVDAWSIERGLVGALRIQNSVQPLVGNVNTLKSAAQTVSPAEITPAQLQSLTKAIVSVLQALATKEPQFALTGARQIVANDIRDLEAPTVDIIAALITSLGQDCEKLQILSPLIPQIDTAFKSADSAYGAQPVQFPTPPACHRRALSTDSSQKVPSSKTTSVIAPTVAPPLYQESAENITPSDKETATVLVTVYHCPPTNRPSSTVPALNNTTKAATSNSSVPKAPELVGFLSSVGNTTDQNNTQLIPVLSNGALGTSVGIRMIAFSIAIAAGLLV